MKKSPVFLCFLVQLLALAALAQPAAKTDFLNLRDYFHQKVNEGKFAGTVILLAKDDRIWLDVFGQQDIEAGIPMAENTLFRLASMTKPVTSVAVMMLVENGKLKLDDPVKKFLLGFADVKVLSEGGIEEKPHRSVTIKDLLTHTSGVANNLFQNTEAEKVYKKVLQEKRPADLKAEVDCLSELPLAHHPGEFWTYGFSTDVLARIVEIVSGESIDEFFKKRIFKPLKMNDTGFRVKEDEAHRLAAVYAADLKKVEGADGNSPYLNGKNYPRGVGGLVSTAQDYLRFCRMLLNGGTLDGARLLKPKTVAEMMKNQLPAGVLPHTPGMPAICNGFGLGFGVQTAEVLMGSKGDCAWPGAYLTYFFIDPTHKSIGIFMTQSVDFSNLTLLGDFHKMAGAALAEESEN